MMGKRVLEQPPNPRYIHKPHHIGQIIMEIRESQGLSLRQVAAQAHMAPATLMRIERGQSVDVEKLEAVGRVLNVTLSYLFGRIRNKDMTDTIDDGSCGRFAETLTSWVATEAGLREDPVDLLEAYVIHLISHYYLRSGSWLLVDHQADYSVRFSETNNAYFQMHEAHDWSTCFEKPQEFWINNHSAAEVYPLSARDEWSAQVVRFKTMVATATKDAEGRWKEVYLMPGQAAGRVQIILATGSATEDRDISKRKFHLLIPSLNQLARYTLERGLTASRFLE